MDRNEKICSKCKTQPVLEGLGYTDKCIYCERAEIMLMANEDLADELTRNLFPHYDDWAVKETLRRLLLKVGERELDFAKWALFWSWWSLSLKFHSRNPQWLNNYFNKMFKKEGRGDD